MKFINKGNWVLPCGVFPLARRAPWRRWASELCEDEERLGVSQLRVQFGEGHMTSFL